MTSEGRDQIHQLHIKLNQPLQGKVSLAGVNLYNQLNAEKKKSLHLQTAMLTLTFQLVGENVMFTLAN